MRGGEKSPLRKRRTFPEGFEFADQRRLKTSVKQEQRDMKGAKGNLKSQVSSSSTLSRYKHESVRYIQQQNTLICGDCH